MALRKAIIIGGGPAGLSTALRLTQTTTIKPVVYELRPEPTTLGNAIGVLSNGLRLLDRLGLYQQVLKRGCSSSRMAIHSLNGGIIGQQDDVVSSAREKTGYGYMRIKRAALQEVLLEAVAEAQIPVHYGKQITSIVEEEDGVKAIFADGSSDKADVLLGADGMHSAVRKLYVDPELEGIYTGFAGLGAIISSSDLPPAAAEQVSGFDVTLTEEGMFVAMLCNAQGDEIYWGFSHQMKLPENGNTRDGWEIHGKEEVEGFKSNLQRILKNARGSWGAAMHEIVDRTETVKFYPVYKLPMSGKWHRGRCLLLGDAAHAMPPHAGQGVSMALEDAFLICRLLKEETMPFEETFQKFDQIRRPHVDNINQLASRNVQIRKDTGPWGLWAKEIAMRVAFLVPSSLWGDKFGVGHKHLVYDIDEVEI